MPTDLLLLWNDIEERRRREYDCWHTLEHVPERTWVPGFRCATRLERVEGSGARYLTSYELDDLRCLESADYQSLVDHPTPWSASMRPSFRHFLRRTFAGQAEIGVSSSRFVWVRRMVLDGGASGTAPGAGDLRRLVADLAMAGAGACVTRVQAGLQQSSGPQAMANVDEAPAGVELVFLLHHAAEASLQAMTSMFEGVASRAMPTPIWIADATYRMLSAVRHEHVRAAHRPEPREDLRTLTW